MFPPTDEGRALGVEIVEQLKDRWSPPPYFYHLRKGGHVAALFDHVKNTHFCVMDIKAYFTSTTRSMVVKALKKAGYRFPQAMRDATVSSVRHPDSMGRRVLPYGFIQSALLATLCLEHSHIGRVLRDLDKSSLTLSVYMDDIIASGDAAMERDVKMAFTQLEHAFDRSPYMINRIKTQPPGREICVFNALLSHHSIQVHHDRMEKFKEALIANENRHSVFAILRYVGVLNPAQEKELEAYLI